MLSKKLASKLDQIARARLYSKSRPSPAVLKKKVDKKEREGLREKRIKEDLRTANLGSVNLSSSIKVQGETETYSTRAHEKSIVI